jgi:hypothetical protein
MYSLNHLLMLSMSHLPEDVRIKISKTSSSAQGLIQLAEYMLKREDGQIREAKYEAIEEARELIASIQKKTENETKKLILQGIAGELNYLNTKYENAN